MWNNKDYEKKLSAGKPGSKPGRKRSNSRGKKRLPPMPKAKISPTDFENYLKNGGYLEKECKIDLNRVSNESLKSIISVPKSANPNLNRPNPFGRSTPQSDFTTSLIKRVKHLEKTLGNYRAELKIKTRVIDELKAQVHEFESLLKDDQEKDVLKEISKENKRLKSEILKIQGFMESYGIKWKGLDELTVGFGEIDEENFDVNRLHKDMKDNNYDPRYRVNLPKEIDIYTISQRIAELNNLVLKEHGTKKFVMQNGKKIFKLESQKPFYLIFYKDGVHLETFPVFKYGSKDAIGLISDLIDGFFPRQLEKSHPDGILFKLIDRLEESFTKYQKSKGVKIGGIGTNQTGTAMSKADFLGKLPKRVIKQGKIVNVREDVEKMFDAKKPKNPNFNLVMNHRYEKLPLNEEDELSFKNIIQDEEMFEVFLEKNRRLKKINQESYLLRNEISMAKGESGGLDNVDLVNEGLCVVKMKLGDTGKTMMYYNKKGARGAELKNELEKVFGLGAGFKILNNFPKKEIDLEGEDDFEGLGFYPRAAVHLVFDN